MEGAKEGMDAKDGTKKIVDRIIRQADQERDQREKAIRDLLFVDAEDGQWEEHAKHKRADRPRYTIDRISGPIDQIIGNQRQTKLSIKTFPLKDGTKEISETLNGLIRSIENLSNADNIYDNAFTETVKCGYGGWRVLTEYEPDDPFVQHIVLKQVNSAASSMFFGASDEYSCKDSNWAALLYEMDLEEYKETYPNATVTTFPQERYAWAYNCGWIKRDTIVVAEYWEKIPTKKNIGKLSDGRIIDLDEEGKVLDELAQREITVVDQKEVDSHKIQMTKVSAAEELEPAKEWAGKYIPLIPLFGKTSVIEGKKFVRGIVRKAKDAQRIYNYTSSQKVEAAALSPKDPFMATPTMVAKYKHQWETFNVKAVPILLYDADPQIPGGRPERAGSPTIQQALIEQTSQAAQDIYATTGIEPASLGSVPTLKSGKAINAEQQMGDRGSYVFQNNLEKSLQYTGEILVDLIPKIYDSERVIKVLGETGQEEDAVINQTVIDEETLEPVIVNDLSLGSYGVVVRTGPTTPTKRLETVEQLTMLVEGDPEAKLLFGDLMLDNMDINGAEEMKERVRKIQIDRNMVKPSEEEIKKYGLDKQPPPDPMNEALVENVRMQTESALADIRNKDADTQKKLYEAQAQSVKALESIVEALAKKVESFGVVTTEDKQIYDGQVAEVADAQMDTLKTNELGGSMSIDMKEQQAQQEIMQELAEREGPTGPVGPRPAPQLPEGFQQQ